MASGKRLRCRTPCMISNHSSGECVHQIDISVRCIGNMQKCGKLQIQFYAAAFVCISLWLVFDEQPAMPDKRVAWSRLLLGFFERRQKTGARLWLMSPSFLPNHRAPKSQFSGAQTSIPMCLASYSHTTTSYLDSQFWLFSDYWPMYLSQELHQ